MLSRKQACFWRHAIVAAVVTGAAAAARPAFAAEITVRCDLGQDLVLTATKAAARLAITGTDHALIVNIRGTCTLRHSLSFDGSTVAATSITLRGMASDSTIRASSTFDDFQLVRFAGVRNVQLENLTIDASAAAPGSGVIPASLEIDRVDRVSIGATTIVGGDGRRPLVCTHTFDVWMIGSTITGGPDGVYSWGCGLWFDYSQILGAQFNAVFLNTGSDAILDNCIIGDGPEAGVGVWNSELELGPGTIVYGVVYESVWARRGWVRLNGAQLNPGATYSTAVGAWNSSHIESRDVDGQGQIGGDVWLFYESSYVGTEIPIQGSVYVSEFSRAYLGHVTQFVDCLWGGDAVVRNGADGGVFGCANAPLSPLVAPTLDSVGSHRAAAEQRRIAIEKSRAEMMMRRSRLSEAHDPEPVRPNPKPRTRSGRDPVADKVKVPR